MGVKETMMNLIPISVDGAIVLNLDNCCIVKSRNCEDCINMTLQLRNWIVQTKLSYIIVDLLDEKSICPTFLEELIQLKKRLLIPLLYTGVTKSARDILAGVSNLNSYPFFITPEDAVRSLRVDMPSLTEKKINGPIPFDAPLRASWEENLNLI